MSDTRAAFVTTVCFHTWQNSSLLNTNIIKTRTLRTKTFSVSSHHWKYKILSSVSGSLFYFLWPYRIAQCLHLCQLKNQHSPTSMPSTQPNPSPQRASPFLAELLSACKLSPPLPFVQYHIGTVGEHVEYYNTHYPHLLCSSLNCSYTS
jgi:hypothetical protein